MSSAHRLMTFTETTPDWIVMSGGAARGVFMLGALDVLVNERGMNPKNFAGVSIGALLAAQLAQAPVDGLGEEITRLAQLWLHELPGRLHRGRRRTVLRELLTEQFDRTALLRSGRAFRGGAVDLLSGRFVVCTEAELDVERLLGMATIPLLDRPVAIGSERWVDGVLRRTLPLHAVLAEQPRHMLIMTAGSPVFPVGRAGLRRVLEIALHELVVPKELRAAVAVCEAGGPRVEILTPREPLPGPLRFDAASLRRSFAHGRAVARGDGWRWSGGPRPPSYADFEV